MIVYGFGCFLPRQIKDCLFICAKSAFPDIMPSHSRTASALNLRMSVRPF